MGSIKSPLRQESTQNAWALHRWASRIVQCFSPPLLLSLHIVSRVYSFAIKRLNITAYTVVATRDSVLFETLNSYFVVVGG